MKISAHLGITTIDILEVDEYEIINLDYDVPGEREEPLRMQSLLLRQ